MSESANHRRRWNWLLTGLVACTAVYAGCYLSCSEIETASAAAKHQERLRSYRSSLCPAFAPAAWIEANVTGRTVVIGEKLEGGTYTTPDGYTVRVSNMILHKWVAKPGWAMGSRTM